MGRHTGPVEKLSRREGIELYLKGERLLLGKSGIGRRGTAPPGQHGNRRGSRPSIYALQLREKQRAKRYYGVRERQFRRYVRGAMRRREERMGDELLARLERRLDNVVYRLGLASTRAQARQFVAHRHVLVNGRRVTVPSFLVDEGDVVALRRRARGAAGPRGDRDGVGDPRLAGGGLRRADRARPSPPGPWRPDRAGRRPAHRRVLLAAVTGHCLAEQVLLEVADRVSRPAASMSAARARLALLAQRLPAPASPAADLAAVAALLRVRVATPGPLLLPDALRAGRAHPLAAAAAGVAVARRAGMAVDLVGHGDRVWLAHTEGDCTLVVDPGAPVAPFDGRVLGVDPRWRCAHELAALTLGAVAARARRTGDLDLALRVVRARMAPPVEDEAVATARARMN